MKDCEGRRTKNMAWECDIDCRTIQDRIGWDRITLNIFRIGYNSIGV